MNDEDLYLKATNEVEGENKSHSLWAKVMALSEGDEAKAKYKYIKLRVEQLVNERKNTVPKFTKKTVDEFDLKYIPVAEFSKIKSIPEDKVIKMIRDGFYMGQIKNDAWYVSRDEVHNSNQAPSIPEEKQRSGISTEKEYIPVEEFAEFKGITPEKVIQMIRDGFYQGRIIDEKWYVSYSEISDKKIISSNEENAIWNPNAASNWSLIFTPAFGSYLHALNWRVLGEQERANSAMGWFYFSLFMLLVYIFMGMFMADERAADGAARGLGFLYLIIWYFSAGRSQAKYVKEKYGKDYLRRGWGKPLLIGVAAIIGYLFVAVAIGFTIGMMMA